MLFRCDRCGKIARVNSDFITDFGTRIDRDGNNAKCPCCNCWSTYEIVQCDEWIEKLIFKVKGF